MTFIQAREALIRAGAAESSLPLPLELQARLVEVASNQQAKTSEAVPAESNLEDASLENEAES